MDRYRIPFPSHWIYPKKPSLPLPFDPKMASNSLKNVSFDSTPEQCPIHFKNLRTTKSDSFHSQVDR